MLEVEIGKVQLRNPILTASGTFGFGKEYEDFIQMDRLGGMVVKGITGEHREGNAYPRMAETPSGMLNAVGLQNPGVDRFCSEIYPQVKEYPTAVIVNVSGSSIEEYIKVASVINALDKIPAIELNISCPNVKEGGMAFGIDPIMAEKVVKSVRKVYTKTLLVKLSPNVTNITEIARVAEAAGADALCCINTLLGMAIDAEKQRPILSTITGGLSGPAIKPIALRMVWQTSKAVNIPIVGIGGIMNATDVIEFMLAGATAVQVGTANFVNPAVTMEIVDGLQSYCEKKGIKHIREIIGMI